MEHNSREIHIYHADAGAGKTTTMMNIIEKHVNEGVPLNRIAFVTFTRAAANVAKERVCNKFGINLKDAPHFRTIHSMCFQHLGMHKEQMMDDEKYEDFGTKAGYSFGHMGGKRTLDDVDWTNMQDAQIVAFEQLYRSNRKQAQWLLDHKIDNLDFTRYCREYVRYKNTFQYKDFTDLLEDYIKQDLWEDVDVAVIDEAQDCSPLQWQVLFKAFRNAQYVHVCGDEKQCQPAGEPVLCGNSYHQGGYSNYLKYKNIEDLDPAIDKLVSMSRKNYGHEWHFTRGHCFQKAVSRYDGTLYCINTGRELHRYTQYHKCLVRIYLDDSILDKWCVYCMRRGHDYKIGISQMRGAASNKEFGPTIRMRQENADGAWILRICDKKEALMYEMLYSYKYGLPQAIFADEKNDWLYQQIDTERRAAELLADLGMSFLHPALYYDKVQQLGSCENSTRIGGIVQMYALNLDPRWMDIVQYRKTNRHQKGCAYIPFSVTTEEYHGNVYSLNVESQTHTYVNGELVTHNCVYGFAGSDSDILLHLRGEQHLLETSYRVPRNINEFVKKHIVNDMHDITPTQCLSTNEGGEIKYITSIREIKHLDSNKSYLFLARNKKFLKKFKEWCEYLCLPYTLFGEPVFSPQEIQQYRDGKTDNWKTDRLNLAREYYNNGTFYTRPFVRIDTIHGVKGDEADVVVLMSDMSRLTWQDYEDDPNNEHKVFYVACTRARETLYILEPQTRFYYPYLF